jgi:hypothetical protein
MPVEAATQEDSVQEATANNVAPGDTASREIAAHSAVENEPASGDGRDEMLDEASKETSA